MIQATSSIQTFLSGIQQHIHVGCHQLYAVCEAYPFASLSGLITRGSSSNMEAYSLITTCINEPRSSEPDYIWNVFICRQCSMPSHTVSRKSCRTLQMLHEGGCKGEAPIPEGVGGRPEGKEQDRPNKRERRGGYARLGDKCKGDSGRCYAADISPTSQSVPAIHTSYRQDRGGRWRNPQQSTAFQVILCPLLASEQWIHHFPGLCRNSKGTVDRSLTSQRPFRGRCHIKLSYYYHYLSLAGSLGKLSGCWLMKYVNRLLILVSFKHPGHRLYNPCLDQNRGKFKTCHMSIKRMFSSVSSI